MDYLFQNQYLNSLVIVVIFWLASYVVTFLMSMLEKATRKTDSSLDDEIIKAAKLPIRYLAILLGFYFGFRGFEFAWEIKGKEIGIADIFFVLIAFLIAFAISRIIKTLLRAYSDKEKGVAMNQTMLIFVRRIISGVVYIITALVVLGQFDVQIGPLIAGLGVAGLAIAFGLQETMANLFAALFIALDKSINVGDWIQLEDGTKAYIEDISWRSVRIRTIGGNTVIVPNSKFVGQNISSYDYPTKSFFTSVTVGVSYDTDLEKAEYVALQSAEKVINEEDIQDREDNPIVRFKAFNDSSIDFIVIVKVDTVQDEGRVQHSLIKQIKKDFEEAGIEIPFPQRVIYSKRA